MTDTKITDLMTTLDVTRNGAERISDIVNAGAGLLLEEGFTSLTKRRIAKRLGISHGNVSYYFPTRESLWHAVSAFRPAVVERNYEFKQRLLRRINDIIRGE